MKSRGITNRKDENEEAGTSGASQSNSENEKIQEVKIEITESADETFIDSGLLNAPVIPATVYQNLPELLKNASALFDHERDRDVFLTGALTILSGCMPNVSGQYFQRTVYTNLFCFIIAPPASGKGALSFSRDLAMDYDQCLLKVSKLQQSSYKQQFRIYKSQYRDFLHNPEIPEPVMPAEPKFKSLFLPADTSSAALFEHIEHTEGVGIICETEADTMSGSLKQDWGSYSDMLRKAFHHEPISKRRKGIGNIQQIPLPRISVALSGTPSQVQGLIKSTEDGLFSRFMFYTFKSKPEWHNVFPENGVNLTEEFNKISLSVTEMIMFFEEYPTVFSLSKAQEDFLNNIFETWLLESVSFIGEDTGSSVKRLGLILYRIAMVLSAIEKFHDGVIDKKIVCEDAIFNVAFELVEVYKEHMLLMYNKLPKSKEYLLPANIKIFYDALPSDKNFTRAEAIQIGKSLNIADRTVSKYLKHLLDSMLEQPIRYGPFKKKT